MKSSLRLVFAAASVSVAAVLASCTLNQTLEIAADGSGTLSTHGEVSPLFRDYLRGLAEAGGGGLKDGRVFDPEAIRASFQSRPGIVVQKSIAPTPSSFDLELAMDSVAFALDSQDTLSTAGAVSLSDDGDTATLRLRFDRATWSQLVAIFPPLRNPVIQQLGPQGTGSVTESDYLSMISFSIGDAAPALLRKSFLTVTIRPHGEILSQSGGTTSAGAVVFRIPVLRILVLDRPLEYSVTYRKG